MRLWLFCYFLQNVWNKTTVYRMQYFTSFNLLDYTCSRAPHSSTLAWKIPWTKEPGRLQSMGSLRLRHDWATSLSCVGEGNGNPLQCSCLANPRDGGAWWAAVYGVSQSRTRLTRLSSSSYLLGVRLIFVMINPLNIGSQNMLPRSATSASPGT